MIGFSGLSGCAADRLPGSNGGTEPWSAPTGTATSATAGSETAASPTPTPTEASAPFPETCGPLPDIDGLPASPSELTEDTVEAFVRDFERVYSLATNDEYGGVEALRVHSVERVDERYVVSLSFDAVPATPTADAVGATPTSLPPDAYTHRAVYRLTEDRMLRELRSHIDDSRLSRTCWTLDGG